MFDLTLIKDLTEMIGRSLTFPDIEAVGNYFFRNYSSHKLAGIPQTQTISTLPAAKILVNEIIDKKKLEEFFKFMIELDNNPFNGKVAKLLGLENILYRLSRTGVYFDFMKRKFTKFNEEKTLMLNWGALKDGKEYPMAIASIDICGNSELVKKYKPSIMEKVYYQLWEFLKTKNLRYDGRIWNWAGDGGIMAYRNDRGPGFAVNCCLEILLTLPIFNLWPSKPIPDNIMMRIGLDCGKVKFYNDTGRIVSDIINYAAHLEKKGTCSNGISISEEVYKQLTDGMKNMFKNKSVFEGRTAYSLTFNYENAIF